ncbi:MAG: dehydrogenase E1 component subunit alpha/beta [Planctomycetota bacterium]
MTEEAFYALIYPQMLLARRLEERILELFQKGYVKGTVTISIGNEATALPMTLPFRPGLDVVSLLHRDFGGHLMLGSTPYGLLCQYLANVESPTHGVEGNVHHGDASQRRFPMMSHLGKMLSLVVGGTWAARQAGEEAFGLAVIGDGGSSTGEFHESLNIASVRNAPVLFLIENNDYAFSTPTQLQYRCKCLADRAHGYGITGRRVDGTNPWLVYSAVCDALELMQRTRLPAILECMSVRIHGHAAYDKAEYVSPAEKEELRRRDPLPAARRRLQEIAGLADEDIAAVEASIEEEVQTALGAALRAARPQAKAHRWTTFAPSAPPAVKPYQAAKAKNGEAIRAALDYILAHHPRAFLLGLDVGAYGSAFKTCKGLIDRYGGDRVMDMPLCESGLVGFALGASQVGGEPIVEFQFADFSTEATTQIGLNAGTWFYRAGRPAPMLLRLPCGGGLTMGAFHSGEFEGLWSRFPGLKLLYPATPQETYEAILAGFYDPNPCLVFEHKLLYWSQPGPIQFDGSLAGVWRARVHQEGSDVTVVAIGAMLYEALAAARSSTRSFEVINPFVLQPLDLASLLRSIRKTGRLVVVQECGAGQGFGEALIARVVREAFGALKTTPRLIASPDVPVPFAPELETHYRPNAARILECVETMFRDC